MKANLLPFSTSLSALLTNLLSISSEFSPHLCSLLMCAAYSLMVLVVLGKEIRWGKASFKVRIGPNNKEFWWVGELKDFGNRGGI